MRPMIYLAGEGAFATYRAALTAAGAIAVTAADGVPPRRCQGLLLPGGGDIHGCLDSAEHALIRLFAQTGRPILGVCRGMQAINVYFGGTLYDRIPGHQVPDTYPLHPTSATGPVAALLGPSPLVNTNHHQAVEHLGADLRICQRAADGVVEAVCHTSLPILGLQWHPERQSFALSRPDAADASPVFYHFIQQARSQPCATFEK